MVIRQVLGEDLDVMSLVVDAIACKERGDISAAEEKLIIAFGAAPTHPTVLYEFAVLAHITGRRHKSVDLLESLLALIPDDQRAAQQLLRSLALLGPSDALERELDRLAGNRASIELSSCLQQMAVYVSRYPIEATLKVLSRVEHMRRYFDIDSLIQRLLYAVDEGRPFAFIRLGDGEGTHVTLGAADEGMFNMLYTENRRIFRKIWFAQSLLQAQYLDDLIFDFSEIVSGADILGIPFESWIKHEFRIGSFTGIVSLTNIVRMLEKISIRPEMDKGFCWQNIHFALARTNFFAQLFSKPAAFGLISGHAGLGHAIELKFGVSLAFNVKVPGEGAYRELMGDVSDERAHFPDVFEQTRQDIRGRDLSRVVFLVAAGYLGKFYCHEIKKAGGIALDIGSIADGWMGTLTRPGMENVETFYRNRDVT